MSPVNLVALRRKLGPVRRVILRDETLAGSHGQLGTRLGAVIRRVAHARRSATSDHDFLRQIDSLRASRRRLDALIGQRQLARPLRRGLSEYVDCLSAWAAGASLERVARRLARAGDAVTEMELAFWLQDDNTGCQTGMVRLDSGAVLFWHTEEDTIGYFDRPRVAEFVTGGETRRAFLYPYLMPGPAFGWSGGAFHALDSLHVRRPVDGCALPTCVVAWLVWRLADKLPLAEIVEPLGPFLDGCAVHVVARRAGDVTVESVELGGAHAVARTLPQRTGCWNFQGNAVLRATGPLGRLEALTDGERSKYERRRLRTAAALNQWNAAGGADPSRVLELLASRRGGSYGYANGDVMAHCVGLVDERHVEVHVESGAALPGDRYRPRIQK